MNALSIVVAIMEDESEFLSSFPCFSCVLDFFQKLAFYRINFPGHHLFHLMTWVLRGSQIFVVVISFFILMQTHYCLSHHLKTRINFGADLVASEHIKCPLGCCEAKTERFVLCLKKGKYPIFSFIVILNS